MFRRCSLQAQLFRRQNHSRLIGSQVLVARGFHRQAQLAKSPISKVVRNGICFFENHARTIAEVPKGRNHQRCFSVASSASITPPEEDPKAAKEEKSILRRFYGVSTVVGTGLIGYGSWWCINSAMKMVGTVYASPHIVAYAGFWFGFGTASLCGLVATALYRLTFIRPEFAFRDTFAIVQKNDKVKALLGSSIRDAKLKTYEIKDGRFTVNRGMPIWLPHKLQMMYMVYGEKGMGLVTTVCVKKPSLVPRALDPNLLSVDFLDNDRISEDHETLFITGDESQLAVRDHIYHLLDLKLNFAAGKKM